MSGGEWKIFRCRSYISAILIVPGYLCLVIYAELSHDLSLGGPLVVPQQDGHSSKLIAAACSILLEST